MLIASTDHAEAVVFFDQGEVSREMLYSEFEAILDGVVPIIEFANTTVKAVYVRINAQLCVRATVFFLVDFTAEGYVDRRWNIPLQQLADNSAKGPDIGAGPVRLACASQCCIEWHQKSLWDPDMQAGSNSFVLIRKAIANNRLGLVFKAESQGEHIASAAPAVDVDTGALEKKIQQKLRRQYEQEFRDHVAQQLKEQRFRQTTLSHQHKHDLQALNVEHQQRLQTYKTQIEEKDKSLLEADQRNKNLKETIDGQASKIEGVREYFEHKLKALQSDESGQLQALQENYAMELEAKISAATTELKETVQIRDVELMYRHEQENNLRDEVSRLRQENQNMLENSGNQLLNKLTHAGINFVAFHQGAGHMTVPLDDMGSYLESPQAYVANKCGVSENQYQNWLEHYQTPVCRALVDGAAMCGEGIDRVASPGDFHAGENDRCFNHRASSAQSFSI